VSSFDPDIARAFGEVVRSLREQIATPQDKFALLVNIDRSYYGKLERGERQPSLAVLLRIAEGLKIAPGDLVARTDERIKALCRLGCPPAENGQGR
jgi:transcriptional regulator with XRE-family HTH domain